MGEAYHWASPDVVSRLTMPQLMIYLKSDNRAPGARPRPANAFGSKAERSAYIDKVRKEKGLD